MNEKQRECLFCKIAEKSLPAHVVYEDQKTVGFLDIRPVNPGHTLLIPKKHTDSYLTSDKDTLSSLAISAKILAEKLKKAMAANGINFICNNGQAAGQIIFHLHIHIIPRFENDGLHHWRGKEATKDNLQRLQEKILAI